MINLSHFFGSFIFSGRLNREFVCTYIDHHILKGRKHSIIDITTEYGLFIVHHVDYTRKDLLVYKGFVS